MLSFNLVTNPWIPVLWRDGKVTRVGILKALTHAHQIREIAASNPMDRLAILRFLLAVLYWCKGNPPSSMPTLASEAFPASWFEKLDTSHACFELLGDGKRFYQFRPPASVPLPEKLSVNYLIHEIPTGSNHWHFRHSTDKVDGLCLSCCAMGLLRLPLFSTSGGRGKPPAINAKPPIYILPIGVSLVETLWLSWRSVQNIGIPAWDEPGFNIPRAGEVPLLTGFTWVPRRVWLDVPIEASSICVACGQKAYLIQQCVFAGIGSTKTDEDGPKRTWRDPHVIYGSDGSLHASDALGANDAAAAQWGKTLIGLLSDQSAVSSLRQIIDEYGVDEAHVRFWAVGFATVQNDKYLEAREMLLPIPPVASQSTDCIKRFERWKKASGSISRDIRPSQTQTGKDTRNHAEIPPMIASIRPQIEYAVSAKTDVLLAGDDADWERAASEYTPMMAMIARALVPGATTTALQRRRDIAGVKPEMRQRKLNPKKGGAQ